MSVDTSVYVVMSLQPWTGVEISCIGGFSLHINNRRVKRDSDIPGIGFFPAFSNRRDAERYANGAKVVEIKREGAAHNV